MTNTKRKKPNFITKYFAHFGLRQICDMLMIIGAIVLLVGLFINETVILVGLIIYAVATIVAITRSALVLFGGTNKRSPEFKSSVVNFCIMIVIFLLALFGILYILLF